MKRLTKRYDNRMAYYDEDVSGSDVIDRLADIEDIFRDEYNLEYLKELVEADKEGRCVIFNSGYPISKIYYPPQDKDGLYNMEVCGVISKKEYEAVLK